MNSIKSELLTYEKVGQHIAVGKTVYCKPEVVDELHVTWKHLSSPYGASSVISLRNESELIIGHTFLQPRKFCIDFFRSYNGAVVTDLVINPLFRNAATLIAITRAIKSPLNFDMVLHTSNEVSDQIYKKLFKFPVSCDLNSAGIPINFGSILRSRLKNVIAISLVNLISIAWRWLLIALNRVIGFFSPLKFVTEPSECEVEEVLSDFAKICGSHFERTPGFLKWRFKDGPLFNGRTKWIESGGVCIGYLVFKDVHISGLKVCVIMDVCFRRHLSLMESIAIKLLSITLAINGSCDAVFTLCNFNNSALKWLQDFPFIKIPDEVLPHPSPIFIHASEEVYPSLNRKSIYLTLADLDYF